MKKVRSHGRVPVKLSDLKQCSEGTQKGKTQSGHTWIAGVKDEELRKALTTKAKINAETFLTEKTDEDEDAPGILFLRPPRRGPDDYYPDPGEGDDPPPQLPPMPFVWVPDLAAQLNITAAVPDQSCPSQNDLDRLKNAIASKFKSDFRFHFPTPDVRVQCNNGVLKIAIWRAQTNGQTNNDSRNLGLQNLDLVRVDTREAFTEHFGFFIKADFLSDLSGRIFANPNTPHRLSANGTPNENGPIHLNSLSIRLIEPNIVETIIEGFDDRPTPDVDFTLTIKDTLRATNVALTCTSALPEVDVDDFDAIVAGLLGFLLATAAVYLPYLIPVAAFVIFNDLDAVIDNGNGQEQEGGAGCQILASVPESVALPRQTVGPLSLPSKFDFLYGRVVVTSGGLFFGARAELQRREPSVHIAGPARLVIFDDAEETHAVYRADASDTFGNLMFNWSSNNANVLVDNPTARTTGIRFRRDNRAAGTIFVRTITVTVTDEDGMPIEASRAINISVVSADSDIPQVCRVHPERPNCQPPSGNRGIE